MQEAFQNSFGSTRRRLCVRQSIRLVCALCLATTAATSFAAPRKNLSVTALPLFDRSTTGPYLVDVENFGPDAVGEVSFSDGSFTFHYPIELPKGSSKEFSAYVPVGSQYGSYQVTLSTNQGGDSTEVRQMENERQVLLISDQPGDLGFLRKMTLPVKVKRKLPGVDQVQVADCYVKPDLAPDRLAGYDLVHTVVLGEGAERLSTEKIEALKSFVLRGGNLVFNGGASAPFLRDTRWASLLPGTNYGSVQATSHLTTFQGEKFDLSSFEQHGSLVDGAKTKNGFDYLYAGLGKVVVMHFNLFDKRLRDWEGRRSYLLEAQSNVVVQHFDSRIWQTNLYDDVSSYGGSYVVYRGSGIPAPGYYPVASDEPIPDNPFSFKPPSTQIILIILGIYAIIVGPINFFVLRKMNKPDLAWVTCPAISLVAALLVLRLAGELYKNQEATASSGILFARAQDSNSIFNGQTQMFFPNFGTYNLGLKNVDQVIPDPTYAYGYSSKSKTSFDFYDIGELKVPQFQSHSLEFAQLHYRQEVPAGGWIQFDSLPSDEANTATIKITNNSPYTFVNGKLCMEGVSEKIDKLEPGKSTTIAEEINSSLPDPEQDFNQTWENYSYLTKHPVFVADPIGFRPGPIVGTNVPALAGLEFVIVARQTTSASHL